MRTKSWLTLRSRSKSVALTRISAFSAKRRPVLLTMAKASGVDFVEDDLELVEDLLLELVYLGPDSFTLIELLAFDAGLEFFYLGHVRWLRSR